MQRIDLNQKRWDGEDIQALVDYARFLEEHLQQIIDLDVCSEATDIAEDALGYWGESDYSDLGNPSIRATFPIDPPLQVKGVVSWSNTGREGNYIAEAIVVSIASKGSCLVTYDGRRVRGKPGTSFFSSDPKLKTLKAEAVRRAQAAWRFAR